MRRPSVAFVASLVAGVAALLAACGGGPAATAGPVISASLLIESSPGDPYWARDIAIEQGADGYELLEAATAGELVSEWRPEFRSHFVQEIRGVAPQGTAFWGVFVWNEDTLGWEPLPAGADLFTVQDGHIMAWALVEFAPDSPQLPVNRP